MAQITVCDRCGEAETEEDKHWQVKEDCRIHDLCTSCLDLFRTQFLDGEKYILVTTPTVEVAANGINDLARLSLILGAERIRARHHKAGGAHAASTLCVQPDSYEQAVIVGIAFSKFYGKLTWVPDIQCNGLHFFAKGSSTEEDDGRS